MLFAPSKKQYWFFGFTGPMKRKLNWGILATGNIARQFAEGLKESESGTLVAVGSRSLDKAITFCETHGGTYYGSRTELLADPKIDMVYIATPHHTHADDTIAAARAGKGILCEKPFTLRTSDAERALVAVKEANVFFMEAFMYRCTPQSAKILEWIKSGLIGEVKLVNAEFAWQAEEGWDNFRNDPTLGGGGLMDVGGYCVSLARLAFQEEPLEARYISQRNNKGTDWIGSGQLEFSNNRSAIFCCGVGIFCRNEACIYGTKGRIQIESPWKQRSGFKIHRFEGNELVESLDLGITNAQLYAYEADKVAEFFDQKQCPCVSIEDTLQQARTMDRLLASANIAF